MIKIAIIYHSGFGHTEKLAENVKKGAASVPDTSVSLIKSEDAIKDIDNLVDYHGLLFGCPTYMGDVSAEYKKFMEASAAPWYKRAWKDKIAGGFTNSQSQSGDKLNSLLSLAVFAAQHGMIWVSQGELDASTAGKHGDYAAVNRMGSYMGLASQSDQLPPDKAPSSGDLKTAELFGARFANITKRFNR